MSILLNLFNPGPQADYFATNKYRIDSVIRESAAVRSYRMVPVYPEDQLEYIPGQFVHLMVPGGERSKRDVRHMSIASHPDEPYILCSMNISSDSEYKQAFRSVREGDKVELFRVKGHFTLEPEPDRSDYIFIAGGVGITPFRSLILELEKRNRLESCRLMHVGRDHLYQEEHQARLGSRALFAGRPDVPGFLDELISSRRGDWPWYYICGSDGFIEGMRGHLSARGVPEDRIREEYFSH